MQVTVCRELLLLAAVLAGCADAPSPSRAPALSRDVDATPPPISFCGTAYPSDTRGVTCLADGTLDLSPLRDLPLLETIQVIGAVTGTDTLHALPRLRVLALTHPGIDDLRFLADLALEELYIDSATAIEIRLPTSLRVLELHTPAAIDLEPLRGATRLRRLLLDVERADLSPIGALISLDELFVHRPPIELALLTRLTRLTRLELSLFEGRDLEPLRHLRNLRHLSIPIGEVKSLAPLASLTEMEELHIPLGRWCSDIEPLHGLTRLRVLDVEGVWVSDLSPLRGLVQLEELDLAHTFVEDVSPLASLVALRRLDLDTTMVQDLSPLAGLYMLEEIDLTCTNTGDWTPLAGLKRLKKILNRCSSTRSTNAAEGLLALRPDVTLDP